LTSPADLIQYRAIVSLLTTPANGIPSLRNIPAPPQSDLDRYNENLIQLHKVEPEFADAWRARDAHFHKFKDGRAGWLGGKLFARVNALQYDPVLQTLESNLAEVSRRRAALLSEHARLKTLAGVK
jgi:hypothetical protein